jgi:signal transduction histidine kinase
MQAELGRHVAAQDELLERLGAAVAIYGPEARLRFFNKAFARMFGYDEARLRSEPTMDELFDDARERRVIEDLPDFPAFKREQVRRLMGVVESLEDLLHTPAGRTIRRVAAPHPFGGVLLIFEDVTDRLALERSYNTLIEVQRDTLDHLGEGIAVFGSDGRLKLSNPAFARLWNLAPGALAGETHLAAITERFKSLLQAEECHALRQQMIAGMEDRRPRAGRLSRTDERTVDFVALPLPDGGVLYRFADVTDSVNVERALVERNAALETADRLKTEFLANISYELRTPLTTIIGFSEMLDRRFFGPLNARQAEYAASIVSASRALLGLIDDILDLANIEAGYLQLEPQSIDAVAMFRDLATLLLERARSQELSLVFEGAAGLGPFVADERRLKQALFNLISNSIKFTPSGGRITVAAHRIGEAIEFSVSDTGVGIAPADQARVFDKFVRASSGRQSGVGLGLALVRNLIGLHGGSVALQSEPGKGTTVVCRLPAAGPKAQQTAAA